MNIFTDKKRLLLVINLLVISSLILVYFFVVMPNRQKNSSVLGSTACGTNTIGGTVFNDKNANGNIDSADPGLAGTSISVYKSGGAKVGTTVSDSNGKYTISVPKGTKIRVEFNPITAGYYPGPRGNDSHTSVVFLTADGNCDVNFGAVLLGAPSPVEVGNRVWLDQNKNGIQDPEERAINGVTVRLYRDGVAEPIATTVTKSYGKYSDGEYFFRGGGLQPNGSYKIRLDNPADYTSGPLKDFVLTSSNQGASDLVDSDAKNSNGYPQITFDVGICDLCNHNNDFGFKPQPTPSPSPSQSPVPSASPKPSPSPSPTARVSVSPSPSAVVTTSPRPSATALPSPSASVSPSPSPSPSVSPSPSASPSPSPSVSPSPTPSPSASPTGSTTATPVVTGTNTVVTPTGDVLGADSTRLPTELPNTGLASTVITAIGIIAGLLLITDGFVIVAARRGVKIKFKK
jgi:SdrD B-like domain